MTMVLKFVTKESNTALHTPNRKRLSFTAATPAVPSRLRVELTPAKRSDAPAPPQTVMKIVTTL
jgi:hypothetical protein